MSSLPAIDKRHSQVLEPPKPKISKEVEGNVWALIFGLPNETNVTRFADHFIADRLDAEGEAFAVERVAEKAREHLGADEPLEAYIPWVRRCLEDKRAELMGTTLEAKTARRGAARALPYSPIISFGALAHPVEAKGLWTGAQSGVRARGGRVVT